MEDEALQGLRQLVEETIVEKDWALALITLDVTDQLLYRVLFAHLDDAAITGGAPRTASLHSTSRVVQGPAPVARRPVQDLDGRPRARGRQRRDPRAHHHRTPSTGPWPRCGPSPRAPTPSSVEAPSRRLERLADEAAAAHSAPKEA